MPDNLNLESGGFSALPHLQYVALRGPDAAAFAHAQFANDVQALAVGQWQWNAWLTAKGRVIAVFALLRQADDALLMLLADGGADELATALGRFVFRRKLRVTVEDTLHAFGRLSLPEQARGAASTHDEAGVIELDMGGDGLPRTLRLVPTPAADAPAADPALAEAWRAADLRLGLARLAPSQREQWTPQQLGLDRLHAFSVKKGCYPGQEIVARTHFLGKAKRAVQLLEVDAPVAIDAPVLRDGQPFGSVVSVAGTLALAVLPLEEAPPAGLDIDGHPARWQPLIDGLAR
ncbi:tRNA-modifying protein YgfZ [Xanthomonas sacchari]|uniref:Folate-binding protein n=1 Tax=Xanthomonas sacchari TaxID=56458 RepID=A0AA46SXQ8_9XANT|nr:MULTISPECIES: folate-binding protein [Xanthomonas]MCW0366067.1 tRNA-modifying protein YgfZ [Xanthomonas sacchari]MCW0390709.1 tRNA-modifying protein YgfZ [Xanthomonas sacchari]MCW0440131.1 tRNA-modifying protein YgfZ [Xanthomonas sacchari]MDY4342145.1 folate-binding protein [Xanthomonas sp. LF07-6]UYK90413.1 folate-binding protein [Xanthomonas sacchari]